jgi:hypothetical protein
MLLPLRAYQRSLYLLLGREEAEDPWQQPLGLLCYELSPTAGSRMSSRRERHVMQELTSRGMAGDDRIMYLGSSSFCSSWSCCMIDGQPASQSLK